MVCVAAESVIWFTRYMDTKLWQSYHELTGELDRADGYYTDSNERFDLDVSALSDECVSPEEVEPARQAWNEGKVFASDNLDKHGVRTLVVPEPFLTPAIIEEALRRHPIE
jgi:hypothetical protein